VKKITNWTLEATRDEGPRVSGRVAADEMPDGTYIDEDGNAHITTSPIRRVLPLVDENADMLLVLVVVTKSGSYYELDVGTAEGGELPYAERYASPFTEALLNDCGFTFSSSPTFGFYESEYGPIRWWTSELSDGTWEASAYEDYSCMVRFAEGRGRSSEEARGKAIAALEARIRKDRGLRPVAAAVNNNGECRVIYG